MKYELTIKVTGDENVKNVQDFVAEASVLHDATASLVQRAVAVLKDRDTLKQQLADAQTQVAAVKQSLADAVAAGQVDDAIFGSFSTDVDNLATLLNDANTTVGNPPATPPATDPTAQPGETPVA